MSVDLGPDAAMWIEEWERMPRCLRLWADTVDEKLGSAWEVLSLEMRNAAALIEELAKEEDS